MGSTKTTQHSQLDSWQSNPLKQAFSGASNLYGTQTANAATHMPSQSDYDIYTPLNRTGQTGLTQLGNAGTNQYNLGTALSSLGSGSVAGYNTGLTDATTGANGGYSASDASGNAQNTSSALKSALSGYNTNATSQNIADAGNYANNSTVQGLIDTAINKSNLNYAENTTPSLNAAASAGGNLNSSRAGAAEAISDANQQANNQATAAEIENNAYNTGLSTAEQAREANLSGLNSTANSSVNAQDANNAQINANNALQQNYIQSLLDGSSMGLSAATTGASEAATGANNTYTAATNAQAQYAAQQQGLADAYSNYLTAQDTPLQQLMSVVGNAQTGWGGTQTSKQKGSAMQDILGALGAGGSLYSAIKGKK